MAARRRGEELLDEVRGEFGVDRLPSWVRGHAATCARAEVIEERCFMQLVVAGQDGRAKEADAVRWLEAALAVEKGSHRLQGSLRRLADKEDRNLIADVLRDFRLLVLRHLSDRLILARIGDGVKELAGRYDLPAGLLDAAPNLTLVEDADLLAEVRRRIDLLEQLRDELLLDPSQAPPEATRL